MEDTLFGILGLLLLALFMAPFVVAWWKIFKKAGYNKYLSFLMVVPLANLVMFFIFAFKKWPVQKELEQLRQQLLKTLPMEDQK